MDEIKKISDERGIYIIEDCAQAAGVRVNGIHVGNTGVISTYSFYPGKNLGALGDGGCVVTNDSAIANRCRFIANNGAIVKYQHETHGINSRLDNIQARFLRIKLPDLDAHNEQRRNIARIYDEKLSYWAINRQQFDTFHVYFIHVEPALRDILRTHLQKNGIETNIHYPVPLHRVPIKSCYGLDTRVRECKNAILFANSCLSLPMFPGMTQEETRYVISKVTEFFHPGNFIVDELL